MSWFTPIWLALALISCGTSQFTPEDTFKILDDGENDIISWSKSVQDFTVVLGVAESGKSTLVQFLTGDHTKIIATEDEDGRAYHIKENEKIGSSASKLYPELVNDPATQTKFLDCPAITDSSRGPILDIAANYFIKSVLDAARHVKFILTTVHSSVKRSYGNSHLFTEMLDYVAHLITDVDKYKDSIVLVVTMVDNQFSDTAEVNFIIKFVNYTVGVLEKGVNQMGEKSAEERLLRKIKLAKLFLDGSKIGLLRMPNQAGPINQIENLQTAKIALRNIIFSKSFVSSPSNEIEFGYNLSPNAHIYVMENLLPKISITLESDLKSIILEVKANLQVNIENSDSIETLWSAISGQYNGISDFISGEVNPRSYALQILSFKNHLTTDLNKHRVVEVIRTVNRISIFHLFTGTELQYNIGQVKSFKSYMENILNWYSFLKDLSGHFSKYDIIKEREKYNVKHLADWGKAKKEKGLIINNNNIKEFIELLSNYGLSKQNEVLQYIFANNDALIPTFIITDVNQILSNTIKRETLYSCESPYTLTISSEFIVISELGDLEKIVSKCPHAIENINIFAFQDLFLDGDINLEGKYQLSMISPKWEIIGKARKISLDGLPGKSYDLSANDGLTIGENGQNGKSGGAGNPAGNLLAVGENFLNDDKLVVSAKGGPGGKGQDGGRGRNAENCTFPSVPEVDKDIDWKYQTFSTTAYTELIANSLDRQKYQRALIYFCEEKDGSKYFCDPRKQSCPQIECNYFGRVTLSLSKDSKCWDATNGGNGGQSGLGGLDGSISIIKSGNEKTEGKFITGKGEIGIFGKGGEGGAEGICACERLVTVEIDSSFSINPVITLRYVDKGILSEKSPKGSNGNDNSIAQQQEPPKKLQHHEPRPNNVVQYKKYYRKSFDGPDKFKNEKTFLSQLHNSQTVLKTYTPLDFIVDLKELEGQRLNPEFNSIYHYSLFKEALDTAGSLYTKQDDKKVLSLLHGTTISQLLAFKADYSRNMIINLKEYVNHQKDQIVKIKASKYQSIIQEINTDYKDFIDSKIQESEEFFGQKLSKEFQYLQAQTKDGFDLLMLEISKLQNDSRDRKFELLSKQRRLEVNINEQTVLGIINTLSVALNFLGPEAAVAGTLIGLGSQIAEQHLVTDESKNIEPLEIPSGINMLSNDLNKLYDQKFKELKRLFDEATGMVDLYPTLLKNLRLELGNIRFYLYDLRDHPDWNILTKLKLKMWGAADQERNALNDAKSNSRALAAVNAFQMSFAIGQSTTSTISKILDQEEKLEIVQKVLEINKVNIDKLHAFEKYVYSELIPSFQIIAADMAKVEQKMKNKSHFRLSIEKWNVQKNIHSMKRKMEGYLQGFKISGEIQNILDQYEDLSELIIEIYDRIQNYQDHKEFTDYLSQVNSVDFQSISFSDKTYLQQLNDLEFTMKSNLFIERYRTVVVSFRQHIFPFAHKYMNSLDSTFQNSSTEENLIVNVLSDFENLNDNLMKLQTTVADQHKYILSSKFNSDLSISKPFYHWDSEKYGTQINQLLRGSEVLFRANVMEEGIQNAVKFNQIGLNFRTTSNLQGQLNEILDTFLVKMTHSGISNYKCNEKYFTVHSNSISVIVSVKKNRNDEPITQNEVYKRIARGDIQLSPYTTWKLQLQSNKGFEELRKFINMVNLELVGNGTYLYPESQACDEPLEKYYTKYEIY